MLRNFQIYLREGERKGKVANTRELRRRIKSVKNTSQITRAMEMVAAVKMKRAQNQAVSGRPYSLNLSEALTRLLPKVENESHPLLLENGSDKKGVILLSTDKGLCGSLNTNLFRMILSSHMSSSNVVYYTIGRKGRNFAVKTGKELIADFENLDAVSFRQSVQLAKMVVESFKASEVGEVFLIYPRFVSTIKQEPNMVKLLPIDIESVIAGEAKQSSNSNEKIATGSSNPRNDVGGSEYLFEPNIDTLLDSLLIHHVRIKIYQALLETKASEHSSRMVAMKNATDNALELTEDLTLTYNQVRQDSITREILEISSAAAAME